MADGKSDLGKTMNQGYVYILSNPSLPGLVKIGQISRSPEERARELSKNTSIPENFVVEFEIYTSDRVELEKDAHRQLSSYRVNARREFFRVEIEKAAQLLRQAAEQLQHQLSLLDEENTVIQQAKRYEAVEIIDKLNKRFPNCLLPTIASVRFYQTSDRCCLEVTEQSTLETSWDCQDKLIDQVIKRRDLGFVFNEHSLMFNPKASVLENSRKFEDFDTESILMTCGDLLFSDEVAQRIYREYKYDDIVGKDIALAKQENRYTCIEILGELIERFPGMIKSTVSAVRICQTDEHCYLEIIDGQPMGSGPSLRGNTVTQSLSLSFIKDGENTFFNPNQSVFKNANKFVYELDDYSIVMTCGDFFLTDEGCASIASEYEEKCE
jgi:hypothetical protein